MRRKETNLDGRMRGGMIHEGEKGATLTMMTAGSEIEAGVPGGIAETGIETADTMIVVAGIGAGALADIRTTVEEIAVATGTERTIVVKSADDETNQIYLNCCISPTVYTYHCIPTTLFSRHDFTFAGISGMQVGVRI
jgi:hypothetical protein